MPAVDDDLVLARHVVLLPAGRLALERAPPLLVGALAARAADPGVGGGPRVPAEPAGAQAAGAVVGLGRRVRLPPAGRLLARREVDARGRAVGPLDRGVAAGVVLGAGVAHGGYGVDVLGVGLGCYGWVLCLLAHSRRIVCVCVVVAGFWLEGRDSGEGCWLGVCMDALRVQYVCTRMCVEAEQSQGWWLACFGA